MEITWIGTGLMGSRMAANLAKANYNVTVWNRNQKSEDLQFAINLGCKSAGTIEEAITNADIIFSCISDEHALRSIFSKENLLLIKDHAIVVDCSTVGPKVIQELHPRFTNKNIQLIDAPVTGGDIGAEQGTLTFMLGGDIESVKVIQPLLDIMGAKTVYAGEAGSGQSLKLINQLLCGVNLQAVSEAFKAAKSLGISENRVVEACSGGAAGSWQLANLGPKIIAEDETPGFKVEHLSKDLNLLATELGDNKASANLTCFNLVHKAFNDLKSTPVNKGDSGTQVLAFD